MSRHTSRPTPSLLLPLAFLALACAALPEGHEAEHARAAAANADYEVDYAERALPELPVAPSFDDLWSRTLRANGAIEAAWHVWRARLHAVTRASSFPNTNVELDVEHALPMEGLDAWDRTTLRAGFDPMQTLWSSDKLRAAGAVELAEARAAGERFRALRFARKRALAVAWFRWMEARELARLAEDSVELDFFSSATRDAAQISGREATEAVAARLALGRSRDALARAETETAMRLLELNALLARPHAAALEPPATWPARMLAAGEDELEALAAANDPERGAARAETRSRERELDSAHLEGRFDASPVLGLRGSIETFLGATLSLPLNRQRVRALVDESRARLRAARADARAVEHERGAELAGAWRAFTDAERTRKWYVDELLPLAARVCDDTQAACAVSGATAEEWLDARRMQIEVRRAELEARLAREEELARIEELVGIDVETIAIRSEVAGG